MHLPGKQYRSEIFNQLCLVVLYALLTKVVLYFFSVNGTTVVLWPPGWLALATLLAGGKKYWPGILIGATVAATMTGSSMLASLLIAAGNLLGALAGATLLSRIKRFNPSLTCPGDYLWLGLAAVLSGCIYALVGIGSLSLINFTPQQDVTHDFLQWWKKDTLGTLLVTPIILAWQQVPRGWFDQKRAAETIACFGLAFLAGQIIFIGWWHALFGIYAKAFLMFFFVAWSAVRFGRRGVFLIISFTGLQALLGAIHGVGFFATDIAETDLTNLWFYMLVLTDVGLAIDFVMYELKRAERRERSRNQVLELLARDVPLIEVLQTIVLSVEKENSELLCCILLMDETSKRLFTGSITSTPDFDDSNIHAVNVDMGVAICSNAAYDERMFSDDLRQHPYFAAHQQQADRTSLQSNWSESIRSPSGKVLGAITIYRRKDTTPTKNDRRLIEQAASLAAIAIDQSRINEELQLALLVYQNSSEAMAVTNIDNSIITINPAFTELTGYSPEEAIGKNPRILSSGRHDQAFYQAMWHSINTTGRWQGEILNRRKNGEIYVEWLTINTIFNEDHAVHRRVALFSDITRKKEAEELIWKQANFDQLTGLPNRSMFLDRLRQGIRKSQRTARPLALLFLDLDHFKEINDTLGHGMGDNLLKQAAQRLSDCVRESDTVARLGGDEFTVILEDLDDLASVERVAQNILQKLASPFQLGSEIAYISTSIGITLAPQDSVDIDELLKNADQAMYLAKGTGRNRFSYFTKSMQVAAQNRMRLVGDLHGALAGNQFRLHYQPIVDLKTGAINKAEALIRWQHPHRGLIGPAEFIPVAEETGLINAIGEWVFHEATRQVAIWQASHHCAFQISINKSPSQFFNQDNSHTDWPGHLRKLGLSGQCITVEITEGLLLDTNAAIIELLHELREADMQISLDDFGTGYSSLSYLQKFDIDYLKIDQSFVRDLSPDSNNMSLCEAIIVMAHKLGMKVIAEGIETPLQKELLAAAGCDYGQGYLFSKPLPAEDLGNILRSTGAV